MTAGAGAGCDRQRRVRAASGQPGSRPAVSLPTGAGIAGRLPGRHESCSPAGSGGNEAWRSGDDRGLTIGSALPYLFRAAGNAIAWPGRRWCWRRRRRARRPRSWSSRMREGPFSVPAARFSVRAVAARREPIGPTRESGLPRPHVGALRDVDAGSRVLPGRLAGGERLRRMPGTRSWRPSRSWPSVASGASAPARWLTAGAARR